LPLLENFDEQTLADCKIEKVHLWVDQKPTSQVNNDDSDDSDSDKYSKIKKKKGTSRQQAIDDSPVVKKAHPRSHEAYGKDEDVEDELMLCRNYFFAGECDGFKNGGKPKKNSYQCDLVHCTNRHSTLFDVLNARSSKKGYLQSTTLDHDTTQGNILKKASNAAAVAQMKLEEIEDDPLIVNDDIHAFDMLYHLECNVPSAEPNLSRLITSFLSREQVPIGSISYVVLNDELIFDRYDGGNVLSKDLHRKILKEEVITSTEESHEGACNDIVHFPCAVLEMIITFLPNNYSGIMPIVCKAWYQEIGCHSPALWRSLNVRNRWPNPSADFLEGNESASVVHVYKDMFVSNYKASLRVGNLLAGDHGDSESSKSDYTTVAGFLPPLHTGSFIDFRFFSETSAIIGAESGYIYMVQAYKEKEKIFTKMTFGPIRIAPKPHLKKSDCKLMNFEIDEQYVIFLFEVDTRSEILTSISKEDLLKCSSEKVIECGDDDMLRYHDISNGFLEFYQNCDCEEFDFIRDFIDENPQHKVHARLLEHRLTSCGYGCFIGLVELYTCTDDDDDDDDSRTVQGMGLISISITSKSTSVIDFYLFNTLRELPYGLTSNYHVKKKSDSTIIIEKATGLYLFIDRKGFFDKSASKKRKPLNISGQHLLVASTFAVSANLMVTPSSTFPSGVAITLDSLESETGVKNDYVKTINLPKCYNAILDMIFLGIDHILLVCKYEHLDHEGGHRADEDIDGHWFGIDDSYSENVNYDFILVQVPTLMVVHSQTVNIAKEIFFLLQTIPKLGTIAMVSPSMFRITGIKESSLILENDEEEKILSKAKKEKKKKKRLASKTEKKDGFARGMNFW
jgi:hypothetical protein